MNKEEETFAGARAAAGDHNERADTYPRFALSVGAALYEHVLLRL